MKNVVVLLVLLAVIAGFILFMRQQDMKKELAAEKNKMELEARKLADKQEREKRAKEEREKQEAGEKEERERLEKDRLLNAEREKYESVERELQDRISALKRQMADLQRGSASPEARRLADEIAAIDRTLRDKKYNCFDFCINFRNIEFKRTLRNPREEASGGYFFGSPDYQLKKGKKRWKKVTVGYHCNTHDISWTRSEVDSYRGGYIPKTELEAKRHRLQSALDRLVVSDRSKRSAESAKLRTAIAAEERKLAELRKQRSAPTDN